MTRYLALTYALLVAALAVLFGLGDYPNDNFSYTIYGYGRFNQNAVYFAVAALGGAAWWNFLQWRKTGSGPASTSIHFVLAHAWYLAGAAVLVGTWVYGSSRTRSSVFGYGRFETPAVYFANAALFAVALVHLRWWRKAGRPGVPEEAHFALANGWFLAGVALLLGVGEHFQSRYYATVYGYGKAEEFSAYLAVGLLFLAAFWNFRQWRKGGTPAPVPAVELPAVRLPARGPNWALIGAVGCGVLFLLIGLTRSTVGPAPVAPVAPFLPDPPPGVGHWPIPAENPPQVFVAPANTVLVFFPALAALLVGGIAWLLSRNSPGSPSALVWYTALFFIPLGALFVIWRVSVATGEQFFRKETVIFSAALIVAGEVLFFLVRAIHLWGNAERRPAPSSAERTGPGYKVIVGLWVFSAFLVLIGAFIVATGGHISFLLGMFGNAFIFAGIPTIARFLWLNSVAEPAFQQVASPSEEGKKRLPPDQIVGDDGWTPTQKRRVAGWFQVIVSVVTTLLMVLTFREYGRNDTTFNMALAYLVVWSIVAFIFSRRLYRWAYPEWDADRPSAFVPERIPTEAPAARVTPLPEPPPGRTCPKCAAPIAADAPHGLCPRCLLAGAFQSILNPSRTGPYGGPFAPPTPEEVQEFFPQLEIQGLIGHGGMGAVYQARQPNLDRVVAVKLIRPREDNPMFAERFVREAKAMAKLSHPNIVTIYESDTAGGSLYLIMEFIDGVTLREAINAKAIQPADAMKIVGQLCDALEYAHRQGVVHRDIKPENILLDRSGKVKVVDFGLAKLADDSAMSLTHTRQAMGTPHYMAPEQWEKPTEVDHRADIYALGVVIYELLTGELPLGRFDPPSVKARLDARIDEIVLRLLAKEPEKRYQNASDVRTALFNVGDWQEHGRVVRHYGGRGRRDSFYEFKSEAEFWGWPLVHIVSGVDPRTGTRRIAKGWVALGDVMAIGFLSLSGILSLGVFSLAGVLGLGLIAIAGSLGVGGFATGGLAVGGVAVGGVAAGWLAVGGVAAGKFAIGGAAAGEHVISGRRKDADFWEQLKEQVGQLFG
jgi:tRNA A-37 threonylcarbamoyl transferase component Bud32